MSLCSAERRSPVPLTSPSLTMDLQNLAEDIRSVLLQLVGGCSETCRRRNPQDRGLTPHLTVEQLRIRRRSPPRSPSTGNRTPPLPPHSSFAGGRRCPSTRGWRRCSSRCTGRSHDQGTQWRCVLEGFRVFFLSCFHFPFICH